MLISIYCFPSELRVRFSSSHYEADEDSGFAFVGLVLEDVVETTTNVRQVSKPIRTHTLMPDKTVRYEI
jgi:hypothetical protein